MQPANLEPCTLLLSILTVIRHGVNYSWKTLACFAYRPS